MMMSRLLLLPLLLASFNTVASTLYRCAEESGVVLYTNQKTAKKNCTVLSVQVPPAQSGTSSSGKPRAASASAPTPGDFPRVSNNEQKARDTDRRAILERELATEQASLDKARQALGAAGPNPGSALRDTPALHERNIDALNKELGKLK
jgi:hypothetical protein